MKHTIVLVDDHPIFRQGLYHLLSKESDLDVVGEADDGEKAVEQVRRLRPDLVIMDINMPNLDGIEATRQIIAEAPETKVMALSVHSGKQFVRDMIQAGASGYILKESIPEEMIMGIRTVLEGDVYLSKAISKTLVSDYKSLVSKSAPEAENTFRTILYTKLHRPPISANIIPRVRLIEAIESGAMNPMTLITAPAGYGKSILASQWLEVSKLPGAWVSLDESDDDLRIFLNYVLEAIQNVAPDGAPETKSLVMGATMPPAKTISQCLLNDLESCSKPFALVLDDYQHITNPSIHELLTELLAHPSPAMHLVLISRRDPPLPLASLLAQGKLTVIALADLRFTKTEAKTYLERILRISISDKTAQALEEKMEGWVTGLHLAALSIKNESSQDRLITGLQNSPMYAQEYLLQEVLSNAPPAVQRHLLQTAILKNFSASLCDALMPGESSPPASAPHVTGREFIDWLIKMHFFVIPLDSTGRWFRYHHLFQQLLNDQLKGQLPPEDIAGLHSRASAWYAENKFFEEAIRHAIDAGEPATAIHIVERNRQALLNQDKWYILEQWLSLLPEALVARSPKLLLAKAWLLYHHFSILRIPPVIDAAESMLSDAPEDQSLRGEIDFFRGYFLYFQNDGAMSLNHLSQARERVPEENSEIRGQIEILHGLAMQMEGQAAGALENLNMLIESRQWAGIIKTRLLATVVYIHVISGNLTSAATANQLLCDYAVRHHYAYAHAWGVYLAGLIHFYRNELEDAIRCFEQAIEKRHILHTRAVLDSMAGLCIACEAIGSPDQADSTVNRLSRFAAALEGSSGGLIAEVFSARLTIMRGNQEGLSELLQKEAPPVENMVWWLEVPSLTHCRALIAQGTHQALEKAEAILRASLELNQATHNTCARIQVMPLLAQACILQNRVDEALDFLEDAVTLATPGGWIRPFVEAGPKVAEALKRLKKQEESAAFIARCLAVDNNEGALNRPDAVGDPSYSDKPPARPSPQAQPLVEPLTNRELDVLELLEKRYQNKEIAEKLFITTETVKGHLKNIYQKLNAGSRREAVAAAKRLKVI